MSKTIDMTGHKYGRLTALALEGKNKHGQIMWSFRCDCGTEKTLIGYEVRCGKTQSCGCLKKEQIGNVNCKHGMSNTPIFRLWWAMMQRCYDINSDSYERYGARGITVCDRWHQFEDFYADMGDKPKGMSLERKDNSLGYSPENVEWASAKSQNNNKRNNVVLEFKGKKQTMTQWAEEYGIKPHTLRKRIVVQGLPLEQALTQPVKVRNVRG